MNLIQHSFQDLLSPNRHLFAPGSVAHSIVYSLVHLKVAYGQISYGSEGSSWVLSEAKEPRGFFVGVGE